MGHLEVRDLRVEFTRRAGLRRESVVGLCNASFDVRPGEVVALVGESGGGKSLVLHAILGLLPGNARVSGEVRLDGARLDERSLRAQRGRRLALVPQSLTHLDPLATAGQQIRWAGRRAGAPMDAARALSAVGLTEAASRLRPGALSGGMARRVLLATALDGPADVLLVDEPTAGLDPENATLVLRALRRAADGGCAVLVVAHDLALVLPFADRVATLWGGRVLEPEDARRFAGDGATLKEAGNRRLWQALPENGFRAEAGFDA